MKLKQIYIDGYKNLIDVSIEVQTSDIPLAIIGNNGSGKSNLIEALLHIFIGMYFDDPPDFDFDLEYEAHNKSISIYRRLGEKVYTILVDGHAWSRTRFKNSIRETEGMPPFPALIFSYYSGTCRRTKNLIDRYSRSYQAIVRDQAQDLERMFVFSDVDEAEWCLLGLFAHRHQGLLDRLSISGIDKFKVTLKAPKTYSSERDDPSYWGTMGAVREFIADLDNAASESYQPYGVGETDELRTYVLTRGNIEEVGDILERRHGNIFSMLKLLYAKGILNKIEMKVVDANSGAEYRVEGLSEGEKQLICVIGGLSLSNQNECLVLLDEPDTHINPAWSWEYESLLIDALPGSQQQNTSVVLATHDPVMISGLHREQVLIAHTDKGQLTYQYPVRDPRGQGVANVLTSEYFGLPSSLDKNTQDLLDERLLLAYKPEQLTEEERRRLSEINQSLDMLGLSIAFRDPGYKEFEEAKYSRAGDS